MANSESFSIESWLKEMMQNVQCAFGHRILFFGLQSSYRRGEATEKSDIDLVLILDRCSLDDLTVYRKILDHMPQREKACGFVSGRNELIGWPSADLFQFYHDTKPLIGRLEELIPVPGKESAIQAVRMGAANLYHAACHSYLHAVSPRRALADCYKNAFFVLQAWYWIQSNEYIQTKTALLERLTGEERAVLSACLDREQFDLLDSEKIDSLYQLLIGWCAKLLQPLPYGTI